MKASYTAKIHLECDVDDYVLEVLGLKDTAMRDWSKLTERLKNYFEHRLFMFDMDSTIEDVEMNVSMGRSRLTKP